MEARNQMRSLPEIIQRILTNPRQSSSSAEIEVEKTDEQRLEEIRKSIGVSSFENRFDNFKLFAGAKESFEVAKAMATGTADWIFAMIYGDCGNGKTHLCEATAIELHLRGLFVRMYSFDRLMLILKSTFNKGNKTEYSELFNRFANVERLIIDDIVGSEWEMGELDDLFRIRFAEKKFTLMTTNVPLDQLPDRMISRLTDARESRLVLNTAPDYRPRKK